jgi:hypothetical protein
MAILRNKIKNRFTQIPTAAITDTRLSATSYRILAYLFSRPDNWEINNPDIQKKLNIKNPKTIAEKWKELIDSGWVVRHLKFKTEDDGRAGQFGGGYEYEIVDVSDSFSDSLDDLIKDTNHQKLRITKNYQSVKNGAYNNTDIHNNKEIINKRESSSADAPHSPPPENSSSGIKSKELAGKELGQKPATKRKNRTSQTTADSFELDQVAYEHAKALELTDQQILAEYQKCKNWHLSKGVTSADWLASWKMWLSRIKNFEKSQNSNRAPIDNRDNWLDDQTWNYAKSVEQQFNQGKGSSW